MWNWPNHPKFVTIGAVTRIEEIGDKRGELGVERGISEG